MALASLALTLGNPRARADERVTSTQPAQNAATSKPLPGPKYMALRYDDDFSYLDGPPGSYKKDFFDPIKYIHLGDDWTLSLGGEVRQRMESETNRNFGARDPTTDTYLVHRYIVHADLKYHKLFRIYAEGIDAELTGRELPQLPGQQNIADINQLFADVRFLGENIPLTARVGRQELSYGKERLIGKLDWMNQTRRFDGAKIFYQSPKFDIDAFWTKPVIFVYDPFSNPYDPRIWDGLNVRPDHPRWEQQLYGTYATYKGIPNHVIDAYFIGANDNGTLVNANGQRGNLSVYTIGGRFGGTFSNFDYDAEVAGQWGKWDHDDIKAWMVGSDAGYTFKECSWKPRIGTGFDYATGDENPRDNTHGTFNQLYPTGHIFLGYIDLVGRENIISPNVNFSFKPLESVTAKLFWYHFWLDSNLDALYNAAGQPIRRNVSGSSGNDVGDEFDVTLAWQVDVHSSLLIGYSHFWPSNFIETSGPSHDPDLFYLQYQFKF